MKRVLFTPASPVNFRQAWGCRGFEPVVAQEDYSFLEKEQMRLQLIQYREKYGVTHVFTFNFVPNLALLCTALDMWYVCWVWDCPHAPLWSRWIREKKCCIFVFDYRQYQQLRLRGVQHVFYLPLCTDTNKFKDIIASMDDRAKDYQTDVSFVGNLYNDSEHSLYDQITYIPPYARGYLESLMAVQQRIWGEDLLWKGVNGRTWSLLKDYVKWDLGDNYEDGVYEASIVNMLGQKITQMERKEVCSYLARHYYFTLYTDSDTSFDPLIDNRGHVDYCSEMPLVFYHSKINIQITLRSITSGMSMRIIDVLASGGFLLTNYQKEIEEYFVDGEDLVVYTDFQDLYRKIEYYLKHENERKAIARAGCNKVREQFTYENGVKVITEVLEELHEQSIGGL